MDSDTMSFNTTAKCPIKGFPIAQQLQLEQALEVYIDSEHRN